MEIKNRRYPLTLAIALAAILASQPGMAGDKEKLKGLITDVQGNTVTIKDANNVEKTITVSPATTYKKTKGLTGAMHDKVEQSALMPGLPISAEGVSSEGGFEASEISFKSEDFRTAQQVNAGTERTNARMDDFGTYEALATTEVLFASGSTAISAKGKSDLLELAAKSKDTKDFRMVVQGFTDSVGDPAANQQLSTKRAWAVTNFLQQQGGVSPGRVQAGDGMGVAADAGSGSNAGARKVVVRLVVDKGVQGGKN